MTIGIRGMGLIGGSFEKAFVRAGHRVLNLKEASAADIRACGLVIVCLPPLMVAPWIEAHAADFADDAIVTDAAGVKGVVCAALADLARKVPCTYVGGHPMAGKERSGYENATADLFKGALTGIGIGQNVGLGEAQLRIADVNGINVGRGTAGGDGRDIGAGHIADLLGQDAAEAVIGACFAAGGEGHLAAAVFRGNRVIRERRHAEGADHGNCEQNCEQFFHLCFLLYLAKFRFVRYDNTTNFIRMQE
jgi:hypothetical protein